LDFVNPWGALFFQFETKGSWSEGTLRDSTMIETIGHVPHALEKMRQRALTLHGISIDMPDGPSSAALRDAADIGLKSVRVRRLNGTCARFDVYLGGGIGEAGQRGLRYKLGVEIDQLPQLIEEVIRDYYLTHTPGQTFSMYWRGKLRIAEIARCGRELPVAPVWVCDGCGTLYPAEQPPLICPDCVGPREQFARLENGAERSGVAEVVRLQTRERDHCNLKSHDFSYVPGITGTSSDVEEPQHSAPAFPTVHPLLQVVGL
jgi:rubredoxin